MRRPLVNPEGDPPVFRTGTPGSLTIFPDTIFGKLVMVARGSKCHSQARHNLGMLPAMNDQDSRSGIYGGNCFAPIEKVS